MTDQIAAGMESAMHENDLVFIFHPEALRFGPSFSISGPAFSWSCILCCRQSHVGAVTIAITRLISCSLQVSRSTFQIVNQLCTINTNVCFDAVEKEENVTDFPDVTVSETVQVADGASQTDEDVAVVTKTLQVADSASQTDEDVTVVTKTLQVSAAAASQTDEDDFADRALMYHVSLGTVIYKFLAYTIDVKDSNLIDKLAAKNVLAPDEKQKIKKQKKVDARVDSLLSLLREKSSDQFESFLTTLNETGQQPVADVVRQALHTVRQTGWNPLRYGCGKTV